MKSFSEEQFLAMISKQFIFNSTSTSDVKYQQFLLKLFADAKELISRTPSDIFFVLLIPLPDQSTQSDLETMTLSRYTTFLHNNSRGYSEELFLTHVLTEQEVIIQAIDEYDDPRQL